MVMKGNRIRTTARPLAAVVLAAGEGKRMKSAVPKVLHPVAGKPMIELVLETVARLRPQRTIVVIGHRAQAVREVVGTRAQCVLQERQLGTGDAVRAGIRPLGRFRGDVLVACGDVPLLTPASCRRLIAAHRRRQALATVLTMVADDPSGYGRVIQDEGGRLRIVEESDAGPEERAIDEVNTGTYCFDAEFLRTALSRLGRNNAQGEYYLTDVVEAAAARGRAGLVRLEDEAEGWGVNSRAELARVEAVAQERLILAWMDRGVTFLDPATAYLSADARIGRDTVVGPNVRIEGATIIGKECRIDGSCHLTDTKVGDRVHLRWGVVANGARISRDAVVGPYAHLRPGAELGAGVRIGNFVEVKKSKIGAGSKANHLAYIGDATVGRDVNIGAGTITCNYDGFEKHPTYIGDRVQIGSDTQLVAPVRLGADCYVAAGSTVLRDVEPGALVFNEKPQRVRPGWVAAFRARHRDKG
ncbi:MAG: UDP-N-acetylglucosamine diphosphorylase/glucosamine-1-phosphate N-acetyltransferase [Candidatus Dadabacteria bacterium]|nr:MAG: UDP-N-acetylglucosamine diphosphorylase/glucosamine-1-phosphate N-acetyltransferase [Candidatus Dadabacteria bacterium]